MHKSTLNNMLGRQLIIRLQHLHMRVLRELASGVLNAKFLTFSIPNTKNSATSDTSNVKILAWGYNVVLKMRWYRLKC